MVREVQRLLGKRELESWGVCRSESAALPRAKADHLGAHINW